MNLHDRVQLVLQQFLQSTPEDAARLQGPVNGEWNAAYFRALEYTVPRVKPPDDWHERLVHRMRVVDEVRELLKGGTH